MALKVRATAMLSALESSGHEIAASVARNPSMVAMFGAIMPEPLAHPRRRTCFPPMRNFAAAHFERVSVVRMARLNFSNAAASELEQRTSCGSALSIFSTRSGTPITPVEHTKTSCGLQPSKPESFAAVLREAVSPGEPVQQFAFPELTITARILWRDLCKCSRERRTGAACTRFVVKTAAAEAGVLLVSKARSRPFFLRPQAVAAKVKPRGMFALEGPDFMRRTLAWRTHPGPATQCVLARRWRTPRA